MQFKEENGRCFAELRNGGVIEFESAEEMRAVEREWGEIQALFGHEPENAKCKTQNAKLRGVPVKKRSVSRLTRTRNIWEMKKPSRDSLAACESLGLGM